MANNWEYSSNDNGWYSGGGAAAAGGGNGWETNAGYEMPDSTTMNFDNFYGKGGNANVGYSVPPDTRSANAPSYTGNVFYPTMGSYGAANSAPGASDFDTNMEPPLLEELGINFDHIWQKTMAVLNPLRHADASIIHDNDLAGPLVFCLLFGASLLLHGKVHFGYIYGIGLLGCLGIYCLLNLMSSNGITLTCTVSVLGYCLLPMGLLSLLAAVLSFKGVIGLAFAGAAVLWCSVSASKLYVTALSMDSQRFLVAYPCCLVYGVFALLAIF